MVPVPFINSLFVRMVGDMGYIFEGRDTRTLFKVPLVKIVRTAEDELFTNKVRSLDLWKIFQVWPAIQDRKV